MAGTTSATPFRPNRTYTTLWDVTDLPQLRLDDALDVLELMARQGDRRFDRAAARWIGRLLVENSLGCADARDALALIERLPNCRDALRRLTHQR